MRECGRVVGGWEQLWVGVEWSSEWMELGSTSSMEGMGEQKGIKGEVGGVGTAAVGFPVTISVRCRSWFHEFAWSSCDET